MTFARAALGAFALTVFTVSIAAPPRVTVLSSRPEHVTGGDVLVEVEAASASLEPRFEAAGVPLAARRQDYGQVARGQRYVVRGLPIGNVRLRVVVGNESTEVALRNHSVTGPILSGPHLTPYECRTVDNGLGEPLDEHCSARSQIAWYYRSTRGGFRHWPDPRAIRPDDIATTVLRDGRSVPFVVRIDSGTINRSVYRIAMLADPDSPAPAGPTRWNRRLIVWFGCCGAAQYNQGIVRIEPGGDGIATWVLRERELSLGYAVAVSSGLINNQHANPHLQGETLMMLKEYFVKRFGVPDWTLGFGYSGGAIQQLLIAQLFPGLLDGIQAGLAFPETIMPTIADCRLLQRVFDAEPSRWTARKRAAIEGFLPGVCGVWDAVFATSLMVADDRARGSPFGCGLRDASAVYDPVRHPRGARCSIFDTNANVLGRDSRTGFARRPYDNVGVQYGLKALQAGTIDFEDFLLLNERVGGYDNDGELRSVRSVADAGAVEAAYSGGLVNSFGGGLSSMPIVTYRNNGGMPNDIHDRLQDLILRARLQRATDRHDNHIALTAGAASGIDVEPIATDLVARWLDAIVADRGIDGLDKVVRNKPSDAADSCWLPFRRRIVEPLGADPRARCNLAYPLASGPRIIAGLPLENDILKCHLRPIRADDYPGRLDATRMDRLRSVFPQGVCDSSRPGVGQGPPRGTYISLPIDGGNVRPVGAGPINR